MTFRKLIFVLIVTLAAFNANASYFRMHPAQVIEYADIAFVGTIVNVDTECYTVEIEKMLYGDYSKKTISVVKFLSWSSYYRVRGYEVGQKEIVFTKKSNYTGHSFEYISIGAGNEGEIEIIGDSACVLLDKINPATKYNINDFCNAIIDYHSNLDKIDSFYNKESEKYYGFITKAILDTVKYSNELILELEKKSIAHQMLINYKGMDFKSNLYSAHFFEYKYDCKKFEYKTDCWGCLFRNFNNKVEIKVVGYKIDSIHLVSNECKIFRTGHDFFVRPIKGKKCVLSFLYKFNNKIDTIRRIDFHIEKYKQPIASLELSFPAYLGFSGGSNFYKVLSFDLDVICEPQTITLKSVSSRITFEMRKYILNKKLFNKFKVYNVKAFNDQGEIIDIKPMTFKIDKELK